jgi:type IV pilus assembly protein PilA
LWPTVERTAALRGGRFALLLVAAKFLLKPLIQATDIIPASIASVRANPLEGGGAKQPGPIPSTETEGRLSCLKDRPVTAGSPKGGGKRARNIHCCSHPKGNHQMLQTLRKRLERDEDGFTLIELMVVVLIIAILLAIAIPTFLGARNRANDRAAQSSLRNGLTAAKTLFTDNQDYSAATSAALGGVEPSISFVAAAAASTGPKVVSVDGGSSVSTTFVAAALSNSKTCFYIKDSTATGGGTTYASVANAGSCNAGTLTGVSFGASW